MGISGVAFKLCRAKGFRNIPVLRGDAMASIVLMAVLQRITATMTTTRADPRTERLLDIVAICVMVDDQRREAGGKVSR